MFSYAAEIIFPFRHLLIFCFFRVFIFSIRFPSNFRFIKILLPIYAFLCDTLFMKARTMVTLTLNASWILSKDGILKSTDLDLRYMIGRPITKIWVNSLELTCPVFSSTTVGLHHCLLRHNHFVQKIM